jgi:hypothetical protein
MPLCFCGRSSCANLDQPAFWWTINGAATAVHAGGTNTSPEHRTIRFGFPRSEGWSKSIVTVSEHRKSGSPFGDLGERL